MKKITALIRFYQLDQVKLALVNSGVIGMTVSEIRQFGWQKGRSTSYRGVDYNVDFLSRAKVELVVDDSQVDFVVQALVNSASTGEVGDGKIFVSLIEEIVRIRTEERNLEAI